MARKSLAENLSETKVMVAGLRGRKDDLPAGVKPTTADELEQKVVKMEQLNKEQEHLKALLKAKTEEMAKVNAELEAQKADTKKRIKLDIPSSQWKSFGIDDKK